MNYMRVLLLLSSASCIYNLRQTLSITIGQEGENENPLDIAHFELTVPRSCKRTASNSHLHIWLRAVQITTGWASWRTAYFNIVDDALVRRDHEKGHNAGRTQHPVECGVEEYFYTHRSVVLFLMLDGTKKTLFLGISLICHLAIIVIKIGLSAGLCR